MHTSKAKAYFSELSITVIFCKICKASKEASWNGSKIVQFAYKLNQKDTDKKMTSKEASWNGFKPEVHFAYKLIQKDIGKECQFRNFPISIYLNRLNHLNHLNEIVAFICIFVMFELILYVPVNNFSVISINDTTQWLHWLWVSN